MPTAYQLPFPRAVFYDTNGAPLAGGFVYTYIPSTTTPKGTWQDPAEATPNSNPIQLDSAGSCLLYGAGSYTLSVTDALSNNVPAYSGLTASPIPVNSSLVALIQDYLAGLTLSNDAVTPNTILDIAQGVCVDSTNAVEIQLSAITKTTAGSWIAGTGQGGMGNGLTIAVSTWYHVFAIINNSLADVYFDTSVSAANAPAGTTAFRRIGSFKTDSSAHIVAFNQTGDRFDLVTPVLEVSGTPSNTAVTQTLASVPPGVVVQALLSGTVSDSAGSGIMYLSSLAQADAVPSNINVTAQAAGVGPSVAFFASIVTNTSAQIRRRNQLSTTTISISTNGWIDGRGRFA